MQPQWITPSGSLGTIPEGKFHQTLVEATAGDQEVFYRLIAGELPAGIQVTSSGMVEGVPENTLSVRGIPQEISADVTSRFAIRAFTERIVNGQSVVDRLADRTFELTISGQSKPEFVTPPGRIATFYDCSEVNIQIEIVDSDPNDKISFSILFGELPPGLVLDRETGIISGIVEPFVGPPDTASSGYDETPYDLYPYDFTTRAQSRNYQFGVEITDGKDSDVRTFDIYVYAKDDMTADNTDVTSDSTFVTADVTPARKPILLTPPGDLGTIRADNFYAFKFEAQDCDGDAIEYSVSTGLGLGFDESGYDADGIGFDKGTFSLPPGLQIDSDTGWFYGYVPFQGATETSYRFAIVVRKKSQPSINTGLVYFTITVIGNIDTDVVWLTPSDLGTVNNGDISELFVEAVNTTKNRTLNYELVLGSNSQLPNGLTLQPSGHITGRVSFNTFCLDSGVTTFDVDTQYLSVPTTFDSKFTFTVNAYAPATEQPSYRVGSIVVVNGGTGYSSQPVVTIAAPGSSVDAIQATAGVATISSGVITDIALGNPGQGYVSIPEITITGGGGANAVAVATIIEAGTINSISVFRTFTITVNRAFNTPYQSLYIPCMPAQLDRDIITSLVQDRNLIPTDVVYRADDANFGVAESVVYTHAYGLTAATLASYVSALDLNHYWKNLTLGAIRTAIARDASGQVVYEVVYSEIIDDLVNNQGKSVSKSVDLAYPVENTDSTLIGTVYPNSLVNMRDQVIDTVGQISPALPRWMTSKQTNGKVLGFTPAWVIAYVKPGQSAKVAYDIRTKFGFDLNIIDFQVDRYVLDRSQTYDYDPDISSWVPTPPQSTIFDQNTTVFDGGSTQFTTPANRWTATDEYDKYLVFPNRTILG